jgi:predicted nuclease of predicted toxin-antitoxin system
MADNEVLQLCMREQRILLTADRDFGELVFVHRQPHAGVIYLRLGDYVELAVKVERLDYVLARHAADLDQFLVVTRDRVRIRRR